MTSLRAPVFSMLLLGAMSAGCSTTPKRLVAARAADPKPLPSVSIAPLEGGAAKPIADVVRGKVAVIDLWASWCTACRPVSARVAKLAEAHAGDEGLVVLGLDEGEEAAAVGSFLAGKAPPHPVYLDPGFAFADALGARELPAVVVVDRAGRVISVTKKLDASVVRLVEQELAGEPR